MSSIRVFYWALGRASRKTWILRHATFLFCAGRGVAKGKVQRQKKDVRFAGLAASNGKRREK